MAKLTLHRAKLGAVKLELGFIGNLTESINLRRGEQQSAMLVAQLGGISFNLAGQNALVVSMAKDVRKDGFDVLNLIAAHREILAVDRLGANALEIKRRRPLLLGRTGIPAAAECWQRSPDVCRHKLIDQR